MDTDDRIDPLTESLAIEVAEIVNIARRLERIALSRDVRLEDTESTLAALEGRLRNPK
jgi:hypothetical protein